MRRRTFAQLLGTGSLGLLAAEGGGDDKGMGKKTAELAAPPAAVNVADFMALAQSRLPKATYDYITTGSADELTLRENVAAFERLNIVPPLLAGVSKVDMTTTVMKRKIAFPILLAPVAGQRMFHPQGGMAAARAAAAAGTVFGVSSSVGNSVEEIAAAANGPKWFQLYVPKDRKVAKQLVQRVERAGYDAIVVTVDLGEWKDADRRNRFALPKDMLVKHLRDVGFRHINGSMSIAEISAFNAQAWDLALSWEFFAWLRKITRLPLIIKGVLREDDARKAVSLGLDGIVVSNHGGRRLDGMPATIRMLPKIVEAVGGRAEVFLDGGIRRGTDVLKALAFGARAVLVGRPYAWALAANGEAGVRHVLGLLRDELENAMITTGSASLNQINRSLLL